MSDQSYKPFPYIFSSKGLVAAFAIDRCPENTYINMEGFEVRQENALSSRLGRVAVTSDGVNNFPIVNGISSRPLTLTTLSRMKGVGTNTSRYAFGYDPLNPLYPGSGGFAYRRSGDLGGAYSEITVPFSPGLDAVDGISTITYRPAFSSTPYAFFASKSSMFKDSGTFNTFQQWGFLPPLGFVNAVVLPIAPYTVSTVVSQSAHNIAASNGFTESGYTVTVTAASTGGFAGVQAGDVIIIVGSGTGDYDGTWTVSQGADATNTIIQFLHYNTGLPNDGGGTIALSLAVVTFSTTPSPAITTSSTVTLTGTGGSGLYDGVWPVRINQSGATVTIYFPTPGSTSESGGSASVAFSGPTVIGNDNNYDYRMTLYNQNTGAESNPTATFVQARTVAPQGQAVLITWPSGVFAYADTQATNFRIYRRGGTLTSEWLLIATLPVSATSFLDTFADYQIADNPVLNIDNDPPCTTALASQYNSTLAVATPPGYSFTTVSTASTFYSYQVAVVDTGVNQEIVLLFTVSGTTTFAAYFQLQHAAGVPIVISTKPLQAMNLAAVGFEQAFLAGDPVNPNRLYYSKVQNPEAFPPSNYIEIGVPSDPIMAIVSIRGQVFVFTQSRIYRVLSVGTGTPDPIPTGSRHGLSASFAWAIAENAIYYLSYDGVYAFMADDSNPDSEQIEWLLGDKYPNLSPVDPLNPALRSSAFGAYCKDEFFLCYTGMSGAVRRLIYDTVKKTWRNDSVSCNAMCFEEDTGELIVSVAGDGMVYKDRRSDWDQAGYNGGNLLSNPIPLNLQTPCLDQGFPRNDKIYNELMLDLDTGGVALDAQLLFDNGTTPVDFPVETTGRQQVTIAIFGGNGYISRNVALKITGAVTPTNPPVTLYQWHIKAAIDAEKRNSFDSFWMKFGTDEFKLIKQAYFEYINFGSGPIAFNVFTEGEINTPTYTFTLPASLTRVSVKVRFPAVKAKLWRFVALCGDDFKMYGESFIEYKPICNEKGYAKMKLGQISAQSGV